jgi:5-(carboxyamino)imidazole ribonucleotide synthase
MVNILGDGAGDTLGGIDDLLGEQMLKLHLYGKTNAALRRKMGHFTVMADTIDEALEKAERGRRALHWVDERAAALR